MKKVNLDKIYNVREEVKLTNVMQQKVYFESIKTTFLESNQDNIKSFLDVGCRDGGLVTMFNNFSEVPVTYGIDYFNWVEHGFNTSIPYLNMLVKNIEPYINEWYLRDSLEDTDWLKSIKSLERCISNFPILLKVWVRPFSLIAICS